MRIPCRLVQITLIAGLIHLISANHQHQVTYSENDEGTSYGYKSLPTSSVTYDDEDSYRAEESATDSQRLITGSGRMAILDKRVDSPANQFNQSQQEITSNVSQPQEPQNVDQNQQQQQQQHSTPPVMNNLNIEWTESIDHSSSKSPSSKSSSLSSSSSEPSSESPSFYAQNVPRYPINYSSVDQFNSGFPSTFSYSSSSSSLDNPDNSNNHDNKVSNGPHAGYTNDGGHQGQYNEPYVGYSESRRMDSEWEYPEWLKELKKNEKDDEKKENEKDKEKEKEKEKEKNKENEKEKEKSEDIEKEKEEKKKPKEEPKKPKYEVDHWYEEPVDKKEEQSFGQKEEEKKIDDKKKMEDDKGEFEWTSSWNEIPKKPQQPEKINHHHQEEYGNKIKKEEKEDDERGKGEKYATHTQHHHDHWTDHWYAEPKKENPVQKKEENYYQEEDNYYNSKKKMENDYNPYKGSKETLPVYSEDKKENDHWYDPKGGEDYKYRDNGRQEENNYRDYGKKEEDNYRENGRKEEDKYQEPEKKYEDKKEMDYYSENDYSKYHHGDNNGAYSRGNDGGNGGGDGDGSGSGAGGYHGKPYDEKSSDDDKYEKPEQIGRRPGDGHKSGGLLESYFWKALPGSVGDNRKRDSTYNYVIHVSKIDLDKAKREQKKYDENDKRN